MKGSAYVLSSREELFVVFSDLLLLGNSSFVFVCEHV